MKQLRAWIQRWIDCKTDDIVRVNAKCRALIALSEEPDIRIGEFYQRAEQVLQNE